VKSKREGKKLLSLREYSYFEIETKQPKNHLEAGLFYFQQSIFSILLNTLTISFMSKFITLAFLSALLFNGCTIEKRTYSNGYHTTWNVHHILPNKTVAKKFQNGHYLQPEITKEQSEKTIDSIDKQPETLVLKPKLTPIEIKQEEKKNRNQQLNIVSDTLPDKLYSKEEENFLENGRKVRVARTGALSSFIAIIASIALYLVSEGSAILILLPIGVIGVFVFGILGKVYLARKSMAFEDVKRNINNSSDYQTKSNALNNLLLADLEASIKLTKLVTLLSAIAMFIALMIDNLEMGALGFSVLPIPLIIFCISLLALLGFIIKRSILKRKIKN
jgi:hypothetical protein